MDPGRPTWHVHVGTTCMLLGKMNLGRFLEHKITTAFLCVSHHLPSKIYSWFHFVSICQVQIHLDRFVQTLPNRPILFQAKHGLRRTNATAFSSSSYSFERYVSNQKIWKERGLGLQSINRNTIVLWSNLKSSLFFGREENLKSIQWQDIVEANR